MTRDTATVYITYYGGPDHERRYAFLMEWWDDGFHLGPQWRGQMFRADPLPYIQQQRAHGLRIVEHREGPL